MTVVTGFGVAVGVAEFRVVTPAVMVGVAVAAATVTVVVAVEGKPVNCKGCPFVPCAPLTLNT